MNSSHEFSKPYESDIMTFDKYKVISEYSKAFLANYVVTFIISPCLSSYTLQARLQTSSHRIWYEDACILAT